MFKFTKKLAIVASLALLSAGQFSAFGSSNNDNLDEVGKGLVVATPVAKRQLGDEVTGPVDSRFLTDLPRNVMKLIFLEASKVGADPRKLMAVNPHWARSMRYDIPDKGGAAKVDLAGIPYPNPGLANFMVDCMRLYMEGIVSRGVLYYKKGDASKERKLRFSEDGTANISDCKGQGQYQVYTLNEARFGEVRGANEDRVVTFFAPFHKAMHLLSADAVSKGKVSDLVVIWRWGNHGNTEENAPDLEKTDYLIICPELVGAEDMYKNWQKSQRAGHGGGRAVDVVFGSVFHVCLFVNQN